MRLKIKGPDPTPTKLPVELYLEQNGNEILLWAHRGGVNASLLSIREDGKIRMRYNGAALTLMGFDVVNGVVGVIQ